MAGQLDPIQLMRKIAELEDKINAMRTIEVGGMWTAWTPTTTPNGSMTYTSTTLNVARYTVAGNICAFRYQITGTVGGTPSNLFTISLPLSAVAPLFNTFACALRDAGNWVAGFVVCTASSNFIVRRYDQANFSAGSPTAIYVSGSYEIA